MRLSKVVMLILSPVVIGADEPLIAAINEANEIMYEWTKSHVSETTQRISVFNNRCAERVEAVDGYIRKIKRTMEAINEGNEDMSGWPKDIAERSSMLAKSLRIATKWSKDFVKYCQTTMETTAKMIDASSKMIDASSHLYQSIKDFEPANAN
eukprot:GHVS01005508.1.p2 GENE.GHVS01005508.1~~GHVS01005508.1.p2  ORF type:complete len:153 (+),score=18.24 GHVS01005508.1:131-589(+)